LTSRRAARLIAAMPTLARLLVACALLSAGCAAPRAPKLDHHVGHRLLLADVRRDGAPDVVVALPSTVHLVGFDQDEDGRWSVTWSTPATAEVVLPCVGGLTLRPRGDAWLLSTWSSVWKGDELHDVTVPTGVGAVPGILLAVGPRATPFRLPDTAMEPETARAYAKTLEERAARGD
jgi:hypothetical protein